MTASRATFGSTRKATREDRNPAKPAPDDQGETGSGKTQATKALLADMRPFNVPALILDFKDDATDCAGSVRLRCPGQGTRQSRQQAWAGSYLDRSRRGVRAGR